MALRRAFEKERKKEIVFSDCDHAYYLSTPAGPRTLLSNTAESYVQKTCITYLSSISFINHSRYLFSILMHENLIRYHEREREMMLSHV